MLSLSYNVCFIVVCFVGRYKLFMKSFLNIKEEIKFNQFAENRANTFHIIAFVIAIFFVF